MYRQLHLIIKAEKGRVLKADAKKLSRFWIYEYIPTQGIVSIPIANVEKAEKLLGEMRKKKLQKAYRYEISEHVFSQFINQEHNFLIERGAL